MIAEALVQDSPLSRTRIRTPRAERRVIKGLSPEQVSRLLEESDKRLSGERNRALLLMMVDNGLRLGEMFNLKL
jgi:site-specific recombinase XerC